MTSRRKSRTTLARYPYADEKGTLLYEVVRTTPRGFYHRRPNGKGGWIRNLDGVRRVLYNLPKVVQAVRDSAWIYVVEGEKDADNLAALGLVATTNSGGPGRWRAEHSASLKGAVVAVLPDNDDPGREHAQTVAMALYGTAAAVLVVELPDLPPGGDVSVWIERMEREGADPEAIRAELERLAVEAEIWEPSEPCTNDPGQEEGASSPDQLEGGAGVERAEEALKELWGLGKDPEPAAVESALGRIAARLEDCKPVELQTAREMALRALKGKVNAPAKLVDAALGGVPVARTSTSVCAPAPAADPPYRATEQGLVQIKATRDGEVLVPLTNFTARIVGEVRRDDGVEVRRSFEIAAEHLGEEHRFEVGSREFPTMRWVTDKLGAQGILNAGAGIRDHTRAAIQHLSDRVAQRTVFTHLGWREIDGEWCYLHAGGAIGRVGTVSGVEVEPPEPLRRYVLPDPPSGRALIRAIRASLRTLSILPEAVTLPTYCATWRAPLGPSDFSLHLAGQTGEGKSELAALEAQHFGAGMDARHLPGAWSSTGNSLEVLAFHAKNTLLVVDDFAPSGTSHDVQHQHREAARLLRGKGNQAGRGRLRSDGSLQPSKPPRALILSTGEDVPAGHSIRARTLVQEVPAGGMEWELLTQCQTDAQDGLYVQAMAGYLCWLAPRYEEVQSRLPSRTAELRSLASTTVQHRRTPSIVADLAFGMELFLEFAQEAGALTKAQARDLWNRTWTALGEAATAQALHLEAADPVPRFLELLRSAIVAGRAHVASEDGQEPQKPSRWGWREKVIGAGDNERVEWQPQGDQIGWVVDKEVYLDPDAAFGVAQRMAQLDGLTVTPRTLWKRLKEAGKLARTDERRNRNTVRVTLQGSRREVLHLRSATLMPGKLSQSAQPSRIGTKANAGGTVAEDGSKRSRGKPSHGTVPQGAARVPLPTPDGTLGTFGTVSGTKGSGAEEEWGEV